ncbi:unnamed protein product, partial [marine sediment metagenome]
MNVYVQTKVYLVECFATRKLYQTPNKLIIFDNCKVKKREGEKPEIEQAKP